MIHEDFGRREEIRGPSERTFGVVLAALFAIVGMLPLLERRAPRWWAMISGGALLAAALVRPSLLRLFNRLWSRLAALLGRITNLVATALLFYLVFAPAGIFRRVRRKDPLRLRIEPECASYWIERPTPETPPESMLRQF